MSWILYGATGYTGALLARAAIARGMRPILAGRSERVGGLARELGCEARIFPVADAAQHLDGVRVVLHAAGPFSRTARPMVDACLARGVHYLDITGEIAVFEAIAARHEEAVARGVMLLPGSGFDVVPSDCLAAHLAKLLPTATHLRLALSTRGGPSHGTMATAIEGLRHGGCVRRNGALTPVSFAHATRTFDFGYGPRAAVTIPWGDVSTAYFSTGIPNIEVYLSLPRALRIGARTLGLMRPLFRSDAVQRFVTSLVSAGGPSDQRRTDTNTVIAGEVEDTRSGEVRRARLVTPNAYTHTVDAALAIVARVLRGDLKPGFQTPSRAYGPDFVLSLDGVSRSD